ncbi:DUF488 domain-containing protein [Arthrobacter sp. SF27]|nr:DUF488 domain-containing protein [Arthrobacter sp. SF27]
MWNERSGIIGVGYEGSDMESFLNGLVGWGVNTLVDVRLNAISRKKGFSKRALKEGLAQAGISYLHLPALGNPKDNRDGFASPGGADNAAHARYKELLQTGQAQEALRELADLATQERVAVLCFEASELGCHRRFVLDAVKQSMRERAVA